MHDLHTTSSRRRNRYAQRVLAVWLLELAACLILLLGARRPGAGVEARHDSLAAHRVMQPKNAASVSVSGPNLRRRVVRIGTVVVGAVAGATVGWRLEWARYTPHCSDCGVSSNTRNNAITRGIIVGGALGGLVGWLLGSRF